MAIVEIGKPFPGNLKVVGEGCKLHITNEPPVQIFAVYPRPTAAEIQAAQSSIIRVGLIETGYHTFFMLLNLGGQPWADMPYSVGLLPPNQRPVLRATTERGYATMMTLIDEHNIVRSLRLFSVTPNFSLELDRLIANQMAKIDYFTPQRSVDEISVAYTKYPNTEQMVKDALLIETAGKPF